jgi:hypothetical protein
LNGFKFDIKILFINIDLSGYLSNNFLPKIEFELKEKIRTVFPTIIHIPQGFFTVLISFSNSLGLNINIKEVKQRPTDASISISTITIIFGPTK